MTPFKIMMDTSNDLPLDFMAEHDIEMVSMPFHIDGVFHSGGRWQEISDTEYYDALGNGSVAGTTLINRESFIELYTDYAERKDSLLVICLSSGLSGTYENSALALGDVKIKYPDCDIFTVDSLTAAGGGGLVTALAVRKRSEGLTAGETAAWLEQQRHRCISLFTVDDLMYLHRGGRLSKLSAIAGSIIGIKPLLNVAPDGTLTLKDKVRGRNGALEKLVSQMKRSLDPETSLDIVTISHTNCEADALATAELVRAAVNVREVLIVMMGPVIGAHVGPGTIALFYEADMTRSEYEAKFYSK